jgi:hypothetical protein
MRRTTAKAAREKSEKDEYKVLDIRIACSRIRVHEELMRRIHR